MRHVTGKLKPFSGNALGLSAAKERHHRRVLVPQFEPLEDRALLSMFSNTQNEAYIKATYAPGDSVGVGGTGLWIYTNPINKTVTYDPGPPYSQTSVTASIQGHYATTANSFSETMSAQTTGTNPISPEPLDAAALMATGAAITLTTPAQITIQASGASSTPAIPFGEGYATGVSFEFLASGEPLTGSSTLSSSLNDTATFTVQPGTYGIGASIACYTTNEQNNSFNDQFANLTFSVSITPILTYTPAQIRHAYGFDQIPFTTSSTDPNYYNDSAGQSQTIAIVVENDDPNLTSDADQFSSYFNLPQFGGSGPTLTVLDQNGKPAIVNGQSVSPPVSLPPPDPTGTWENEEVMDVEWAHALAPAANIDVVEVIPATTISYSGNIIYGDLLNGAKVAGSLAGVSVVSMSWYATQQPIMNIPVEDPSETSYDAFFTGYPGVTYVGTSGDVGANLFGYPAASPNVLTVGGISLMGLDAKGDYPGTGTSGEVAWSDSGGGISQYEKEPLYQQNGRVQSNGMRAVPDVAFDADPMTGVYIYNSFVATQTGGPYAPGIVPGWRTGDGTSLGAPCWAALIAIIDGQLAGAQSSTLNGYAQTLPALYSLPRSDFNDIIHNGPAQVGSYNAFSAGAGYDLATGLGTPKAQLIVPAVINGATVSSLSSSLGSAVYGQKVTLTASVAAVNPLAGTPTGTVAFYLDGSKIGSASINATTHVATFNYIPKLLGTHTITAEYLGSAPFLASIPPGVSLVVNQANSVTSIRTSLNPSPAGQSVTFTATVRAQAPGSGIPTGTVAFLDQMTLLGTSTLSNGVATLPVTLLTGTHYVTADYLGDTNFLGSGTPNPLKQVISGSAASAIGVTASDRALFSAGIGQSLVYTPIVPVSMVSDSDTLLVGKKKSL